MYGAIIGLMAMGVGIIVIIRGENPNELFTGLGIILIGGFISLIDVIADKKTGPK